MRCMTGLRFGQFWKLWTLSACLSYSARCTFAQTALEPICLYQGQCSSAALKASGQAGVKVLQFIPQTLSTTITMLDLTGNIITAVGGSDLDRYPLLVTITLTNNPLKTIPSTFFGRLPLLKYVYLNKLVNVTLPRDLFVNNTLLIEVGVENSGLSALPAGLFRNNPNLASVTLKDNALNGSSISDATFDFQRAPTMFIYLSSNPITFLRESFFYGLARQSVGTITIEFANTLMQVMSLRMSTSVSFASGNTNPGYQRWLCPFSNRVSYSSTYVAGTLSNFCAFKCRVCPSGEYALRQCTNLVDTVCAPLPTTCQTLGDCSGLQLDSVPLTLPTDVRVVNMTGNRVFAVESRALDRYPSATFVFAGNPGSVGACIWAGTSPNATVGMCTHRCYEADATVCGGGTTKWIAGNCTAVLPALCAACRTASCLSQDSYRVTNCSVYTDRTCTQCDTCADSEFAVANCTEYSNRVCAACVECGLQSYASRNCSTYFDAECSSCDASCDGCVGPSDKECAVCAAGYTAIVLPGVLLPPVDPYSDPVAAPAEAQCVPYVDCTYLPWSNWSACTLPCGTGQQRQTRALDTLWPCTAPQSVQEVQECNTDICIYPTLKVAITLLNVTASRLNDTAVILVGELVAATLKQPLGNIKFASSLEEYDNVTVSVTNATSGENSTYNSTVPSLKLSYVIIFADIPAFNLVTESEIAKLSGSLFSRALEKVLGFNVTATVKVTIPPALISPSPTPSQKPVQKLNLPIPAIAGGGGGVLLIVALGIVCYKQKWYIALKRRLKYRQAVASKAAASTRGDKRSEKPKGAAEIATKGEKSATGGVDVLSNSAVAREEEEDAIAIAVAAGGTGAVAVSPSGPSTPSASAFGNLATRDLLSGTRKKSSGAIMLLGSGSASGSAGAQPHIGSAQSLRQVQASTAGGKLARASKLVVLTLRTGGSIPGQLEADALTKAPDLPLGAGERTPARARTTSTRATTPAGGVALAAAASEDGSADSPVGSSGSPNARRPLDPSRRKASSSALAPEGHRRGSSKVKVSIAPMSPIGGAPASGTPNQPGESPTNMLLHMRSPTLLVLDSVGSTSHA